MLKFCVGYIKLNFEDEECVEFEFLKDIGVEFVEIELLMGLFICDIMKVLDVEVVMVFDELMWVNDIEGLNVWGWIFW